MNPHHETIRRIVGLLAERRYTDVLRFCGASRLSAEELEAAIGTYGRTIAPLPDEALSLIDSVSVQSEHPTWSVVVPLFTREEGRSDLSLELTLTEPRPGAVSVELDDLRVL